MAMELKRIAESHSGLLRPIDVVESARSENSALHSWFEWNESKAAQEYRLDQARRLIRVNVSYLQSENKIVPYRVFVSLSADRLAMGGGYRDTVSVMADEDMRQFLLADALRDLQRFQLKYQMIRELQAVFEEIKRVQAVV